MEIIIYMSKEEDYESSKKNKRRTFVRPNCNKVWCFQCYVCLKKHYKYAAHAVCYRRWCEICQFPYETEKALKEHAKHFHQRDFCEVCNQVFPSLKVHKLSTSHKTNVSAKTKVLITNEQRDILILKGTH